MDNQKIFWGSNIKLLRTRLKMSQEDLAETLSITRSKLNAQESGKTVNPPAEDLLKFSAFFHLSIDTLMKTDLRKVSELKIRALESGNDDFITGTHLRVLATTVDKNNKENAEYVPVKAKAGYASGHTDPEYIAELPRFSMPQLPQNQTYRMFPTSGDSMLPIPENSLVIGSYVQDWLQLKDDTLCILILKSVGQDFVFKQVENRLEKELRLILKSLNEVYKPYEVSVTDILEIWKFESFVSNTVPAGNISMGFIAQALQEIKVDVAKLSAQQMG